jgi:putative peptide-modifying radical SAM enzyme
VFFHIILTDDCNLNCSYCRGKLFTEDLTENSEVIDHNLPVNLSYDINHLVTFLERDPEPVISFYGGEPLLCTEKIRTIIDATPTCRYFIQTNGLLIKELEPEYWRQFSTVLISVDGNKTTTDHYRGEGVYEAVSDGIHYLRDNGFNGEVIARMTVADDTDIYESVSHLLGEIKQGTLPFNALHWQIDANFWSDFHLRDFREWVETSYKPGISRLIREWTAAIQKGEVQRIYPFIDCMDDLLHSRSSKLRCGSGHSNYTILTDGHIAPCPCMTGMVEYYAGHIQTANPTSLPEITIKGECLTCDIAGFCGGRCLYANVVQPWPIEGRRLICDTVRHLKRELEAAIPVVQSCIEQKIVTPNDFSHEKYNGCEIIP